MIESGFLSSWRAWHDFSEQVAAHPECEALTVQGETFSYADINARVRSLSNAIAEQETKTTKPVAGIFAGRRADTYAAILAALSRGYAYVPLNPRFPAERNRYILDRSGASVVLFANEEADEIQDIFDAPSGFERVEQPARIIMDDAVSLDDPPAAIHDNPYAYVLFTSGSTGQPKGVAIRHSNLESYLDATFAVTDYNSSDRVSQNFDLTFDLSVHDMFVTYRAGAHLIVPSEEDLERPAQYISEHGVTCWFSVPSLAQKIRMQQDLKPTNLDGLRLTLFCGEALPVDLAREWAAVTGQRVENWYGPTEATISATRFVLPSDPDLITGRNNLVPIGKALPGMATAIDTNGELLLLGPQVADGYVEEPEKTASAFITHEGDPAYRTGDRAEVDTDGNIHFIDRIDNQIKMRGYRVELGEIEALLRQTSDGCAAVVIPLPLKSPSPTTLVGVVEGYPKPGKVIRKAIEGKLPDYMEPARVLVMPNFPKNASGKVDRGQIGERVLTRLRKMNAKQRPKKLKRYDAIIDLVQEINPAISREQVEDAENLMDAGLDSLGFVEFSLLFEGKWDLNLTQERIAELSTMSLWQIVTWLRRELDGTSPDRFEPKQDKQLSKGELKRTLHYRAMRALDFLDKFPDWLSSDPTPAVPLIGSSGFMRAVSPSILSETAQQAEKTLRPLNVGMAMLTAKGIAEFCGFISQTATRQNKRFPLSVLELELMQLSIKPPAGDIEILQDYEAGHFKSIERKHYDADTIWDAETAGEIAPANIAQKLIKQANWEKKRNLEIRSAFEGGVAMDEAAVAAWREGLDHLMSVSEEVVVVIHPIQGLDPRGAREKASTDHYTRIVETALRGTNVTLIDENAFDLEDEDFKNISHVNDHSGRKKFSGQLGRKLFL